MAQASLKQVYWSHYPAVSEGLRSVQLSGQHVLVMLVVIGKRRKKWNHGHHGHSNYCFHTPYQNMVLQESARIWWTVELTHHVGQVRDHMDDDNCTGVWRENMMLRGSQRQPRSWLRNKDYWKSLTGHWILLSRRNPHLGTSQARLLLELQRRKDKRSNLFLISSPGSLPQLTASYLCLK